jgi:predicted O-methyltransferase YrrM
LRDYKSIGEIALLLDTEVIALQAFIKEAGLDSLISKGRIAKSDLRSFFQQYKESVGGESQVWTLPKWFLSSDDPVMNILRDMYGQDTSFRAALPPSQGRILRKLILEHQPKNVVEIGCYIGISSLWIGSALQQVGRGHLFGVDTFIDKEPRPPYCWDYLQSPQDFARRHVEKAGLKGIIDFVQSKSSVFGENFPSYTKEKIDFLFIDGDHRVGGCIDDLISFYPHVKEGGHILLHDTNPERCGWHGPRYLLDHCFNDSSLFEATEIDTEPNYGMALITKLKDSKSFYPWRNPRLEMRRRLHRFFSTLGYSDFYQRIIMVHMAPLHRLIKSIWK